jgi:hypothetical protein
MCKNCSVRATQLLAVHTSWEYVRACASVCFDVNVKQMVFRPATAAGMNCQESAFKHHVSLCCLLTLARLLLLLAPCAAPQAC